MLFAAGAIFLEQFIFNRFWNWLKPLLILHLIIAGFVIIPFGLPVLSVEKYIKYADWIGITPEAEERKEMGKLPQHYADMHGWEEMAEIVAFVYYNLTPEEQEKTSIFTWETA